MATYGPCPSRIEYDAEFFRLPPYESPIDISELDQWAAMIDAAITAAVCLPPAMVSTRLSNGNTH